MRLCLFIFCWFISLSSVAQNAKTPQSIENFAKFNVWSEVKISPSGKYLSAINTASGKRALVLFDAKTYKPIHWLNFGTRGQSGEHFWGSDERIIVEKEYLTNYKDHPISYGEYFAVNADGSRDRYIFGADLNGTGRTHKSMWGKMVDPMPADNKYALILGTKMSNVLDYRPELYKVNIRTAYLSKLMTIPLRNAQVLTDSHQNVQFASGYDDDDNYVSMLYRQGEWLSTADLNIQNESFNPIAIKANSSQVYATFSEAGGPAGLYLFDLNNGKKTKIYQHDKVSIAEVMLDHQGNVYAVALDDGYPTVVIVDKHNPEAKLQHKLNTQFAGFNVDIISQTLDGNRRILKVYNQFYPGDYFLYNVGQNKLVRLFQARPWVDPQTAANMVPFWFNNREGQPLLGYLTLPPGIDSIEQAKNLPFVINVHGGPHGVRDYMGYDSENQLYASHGIAVLQVNYRGSGGFGWQFEAAGYRHWGDKVQYDIIDGINALVTKGVADKNRLCILGYSFGGYSALQSAILAPDLFQCSIGIVGVYDLALMHEVGNIQKRSIGRTYLDDVIGNDEKALRAASPVYHLDKLKSAVMLIHGGKDKRVPLEHAEALKEGLDKRGLPYQWLVIDKEGHGFYKPQNRELVLLKTLTFLQQHLGLKPQ